MFANAKYLEAKLGSGECKSPSIFPSVGNSIDELAFNLRYKLNDYIRGGWWGEGLVFISGFLLSPVLSNCATSIPLELHQTRDLSRAPVTVATRDYTIYT